MTLLAAQNLVCVRGDRILFEGLGFALDAGEALLLTGPNGSGKSSLLRMLAGLLRPAAGNLTWAGEGISRDPEAHRARLCYVGHQDPVKPVLTARENLLFWAGLHGGSGAGLRADAKDAVAAALARFGLAALADLPARVLSAGQRRRLNLARLLVGRATLWLLDEPTVALDAASVADLEAVVAAHRASGGMAVLATHLDLALPDARRLAVQEFAPAPEFAPAEADA